MSESLGYTVHTRSGQTIEFDFPLHGCTGSPRRVAAMLGALLDALDRDVDAGPDTFNGDVLQAVAMALAVRAALCPGPRPVVRALADQLVEAALDAAGEARPGGVAAGRA